MKPLSASNRLARYRKGLPLAVCPVTSWNAKSPDPANQGLEPLVRSAERPLPSWLGSHPQVLVAPLVLGRLHDRQVVRLEAECEECNGRLNMRSMSRQHDWQPNARRPLGGV